VKTQRLAMDEDDDDRIPPRDTSPHQVSTLLLSQRLSYCFLFMFRRVRWPR